MKQIATITVIGKDRTGVIARFTNLLFEQGANIEALEEQVTRGQFSMIIQASWPRSRFNRAAIENDLAALAASLKMEASCHFTQPDRPQRMTLKQMIQKGQKLESKVLAKAVGLFLTKKLDVHWGVVKEI